jgi:hypothetical protein
LTDFSSNTRRCDLREKKPIRRGDEGYDRAAAIAELRVNAYDAVLTFPGVFKGDSWSNVARSAFRDSPIMCEFISMYKDNYSKNHGPNC